MIQKQTNDKITPVLKCSPTIYTFTTALTITTTGLLAICTLHTPSFILKILFISSGVGLLISLFNWAKLVIDDQKY